MATVTEPVPGRKSARKSESATERARADNGKRKGVSEKRAAKRQGNDNLDANENQIDSLCRTIQSLERQRRFALKQCVRGENAITAYVAWNACGFHTGLGTEQEREKRWKQAGKLIKEIDGGDAAIDTELASAATADEAKLDTDGENVTGVVLVSKVSRRIWTNYENALVAKMVELAGQLPVAKWLEHPDQRGISLVMLATIVGEAGNLSNYANPAKLWRRLFGAPITKNGKTMMPSRWRLEGGLSSEEWEEAGYAPHRHATMQQLKENIVMQNGPGPYRRRYDEAKERTRTTHPEWWKCSKCDGKGKVDRKKCANCKGTGEVALHAHRHAQLLAAKRFVRELWNEWNGVEFDPERVHVPRSRT